MISERESTTSRTGAPGVRWSIAMGPLRGRDTGVQRRYIVCRGGIGIEMGLSTRRIIGTIVSMEGTRIEVIGTALDKGRLLMIEFDRMGQYIVSIDWGFFSRNTMGYLFQYTKTEVDKINKIPSSKVVDTQAQLECKTSKAYMRGFPSANCWFSCGRRSVGS